MRKNQLHKKNNDLEELIISDIKIPKIFHRIWLSGGLENPMPDEFVYYGQTFIDLHPDWEYKLWTDKNIPVKKFINKELYESIDGLVLKADIARFELLYMFGGVYADVDFEFYKNIEPIIKDLECFSAGEKDGIIGNAILGSTPAHKVFLKLINAAPESIKENEEYGPNIKTGPVFMTKTLSFDEIYTFSPFYFFPTPPGMASPPGEADKYPGAYANHHWAGSWIDIEDKIKWEQWYKDKHNWDNWFEKEKDEI